MTRLDQAFIKIYADRGHESPGSAEDLAHGLEIAVPDCREPVSGESDEPPAAETSNVPEACVLASLADEVFSEPEEPNETAHLPDLKESVPTDDAAILRLDQGARSGTGAWIPEGYAAPAPHVALPNSDSLGADSHETEENASEAEILWDEATDDDPFWAMLQVDRLTWPSVCLRLGKVAADELQRLADALVEAMADGVRVVAIGGCRRGEGATTLLLCLGRRMAQLGLKVVLVDAHLADPQLASRLELQPESGWEAAIEGQIPLEEVVIESLGDHLAVLPACRAFQGTDNPTDDETRLVEGLDALAAHYDLVLVDPGPLEELGTVGGSLARGLGSRLDAIALVHHVGLTPDEDLDEVRRSLGATEIVQLGVIENYVRQTTEPSACQ